MCELFGLSANRPVSFACSLERFSAHGSPEGPNHDGWGVAAYDGPDARIIKDAAPAADSEWVRFVETHGVLSNLVIAHIRRASWGDRSYANTHPFSRELAGCRHLFAHNGSLPNVRDLALPTESFRPIGETDSEYAYCSLLTRLAEIWLRGDRPSVAARHAVVAQFASELAELGPANFLYADGELLFAHGHRRKQANGNIAAPGLFSLERSCARTDEAWRAAGVELGAPDQEITVVASVPLTQEPWRPLREGELVVISSGKFLQ